MRNGEYNLVVAPDNYTGMKYRGKYCYEHHLVWWMNTGITINDDQIIHHLDENKRNNLFVNLELHTRKDHGRMHGLERKAETIETNCIECKISFVITNRDYKRRAKKVGENNLCCSRSCQVKKQQKERYL